MKREVFGLEYLLVMFTWRARALLVLHRLFTRHFATGTACSLDLFEDMDRGIVALSRIPDIQEIPRTKLTYLTP